MKLLTHLALLIITVLIFGCKKPKPIVFTGQVLFTKKVPKPLSNRKVEIFQLGGNAILLGSAGSSATAITDANGYFRITFVPGDSYFLAFSGANTSALTLAGIEGFPYFARGNFPEPGYDATKPIFVGKLIDTLIIKVFCFKDITPSDTFALKGTMIDASFNKKYSGITADSATTFTLDTIYNALFTNYDCIKKTFGNIDIEFGRLKTYLGSTTPFFTGKSLYWLEFPPEDETKREMTFYFSE